MSNGHSSESSSEIGIISIHTSSSSDELVSIEEDPLLDSESSSEMESMILNNGEVLPEKKTRSYRHKIKQIEAKKLEYCRYVDTDLKILFMDRCSKHISQLISIQNTNTKLQEFSNNVDIALETEAAVQEEIVQLKHENKILDKKLVIYNRAYFAILLVLKEYLKKQESLERVKNNVNFELKKQINDMFSRFVQTRPIGSITSFPDLHKFRIRERIETKPATTPRNEHLIVEGNNLEDKLRDIINV
eukprot:TRINITY_DN2689_c0_g1_i2.p1 TRINITY_DN2689_c0_g1~~TRINITY_DN2689_c0_g1_i2.p1  ORF type:complete len:246 (+),score=47.62 TRINITY_DN2689_c0_g1_i2:16-753(+)